MKRKHSLLAVAGPVVILSLLLVVVLASQRGMRAPQQAQRVEQLPLQQEEEAAPALALLAQEQDMPALVLTGTEDIFRETMQDTLELMDIPYESMDISRLNTVSLEKYSMVLVCTSDLSPIEGETMVDVFDWVGKGGRFALMAVPDIGMNFQIISRKLGIEEMNDTYVMYHAFQYEDGVMPVYADRIFDVELEDYALSVFLSDDCRIYMKSGGAYSIPLLWTRDEGKGRVAVFNTGLLQGKVGRGYALEVLSALCDTLCYPVINAGMIFIDDFPAPQPSGFDEALKAQFGYDVQGFYRNHWWPDMKELTWLYGLRYTGVLVETYNQTVEPPFEPDSEDRTLIQYYMSELLQSGGEVGLHGYNHQPLCPDGFQYAGEDYITWSGMENMCLATQELFRYGQSILPYASFTTYVPPSNYLSPMGQQAVQTAVPGITTISGLYLPEEGVNALIQEFEEEGGAIAVPRISSGFTVDAYNELAIAHELMLQGVFSHFIHPDDVLDIERGADLGWTRMYEDFTALLEKITQAYPPLRWYTASEGAAAVQRYDRVQVARQWEDGALVLYLQSFYDEAWLALRCETPPAAVENAELFELSEGFYWLRATDAQVRITWENEQ